MTARIALLLGRTVWTRDAGVWRSETFSGEAGLSRDSVARIAEFLSAAPTERAIAVFEPDGMAHQAVEIPKVNRTAFVSLARVRSEYPVVTSEDLGWGIEYPESGPGGTFSTLIHSELTPGLIHVRDTCVRGGSQLCAAWSAYSAAIACVESVHSAPKARFALILTNEFAAIASFGGGRRSFRAWTGIMSERDWKAFSIHIGDVEAGPSPTMGEAVLKRGSMVVIAESEPERFCPIWKDLRTSGRVEVVVNLEAFALSAARIPTTHPANLADAFPRPRDLDRFLVAAAITGASVAMAFGAAVLEDRKKISSEDAADRARVTSLEVRANALGNNQREMARLRREAPDGPGSFPMGCYDALAGLAAALPDALTLTSLTIENDRHFELVALVIGTDFEPENTRISLERCGFAPMAEGGWTYDAGSARLVVRGRYGDPRQ